MMGPLLEVWAFAEREKTARIIRTKAFCTSSLLKNPVFLVLGSEFQVIAALGRSSLGRSIYSAVAESKLCVMYWPSGFAIGRGCKQPR